MQRLEVSGGVRHIYVIRRLKVKGVTYYQRGTRWRSWLRHCATSRKVAGPIPDYVIGIFH